MAVTASLPAPYSWLGPLRFPRRGTERPEREKEKNIQMVMLKSPLVETFAAIRRDAECCPAQRSAACCVVRRFFRPPIAFLRTQCGYSFLLFRWRGLGLASSALFLVEAEICSSRAAPTRGQRPQCNRAIDAESLIEQVRGSLHRRVPCLLVDKYVLAHTCSSRALHLRTYSRIFIFNRPPALPLPINCANTVLEKLPFRDIANTVR